MEETPQIKNNDKKDFTLGCTINVVIGIAMLFILIFITMQAKSIANILFTIAVVLFIVSEIILIVKIFKKYRYIAIGLICGLVVPLLIIGSCASLFNAFRM